MAGDERRGYKRFLDSGEDMNRQTQWRRTKQQHSEDRQALDVGVVEAAPLSSAADGEHFDSNSGHRDDQDGEPGIQHGGTYTDEVGDTVNGREADVEEDTGHGSVVDVLDAVQVGDAVDHTGMGAEDEVGQGPALHDTDPDIDERDVMSLILAYSIRHNLSKVAIGDLLDLLHALGATKNVPPSKYVLLKSVMQEIGDQKFTHFYCSACLAYVNGGSESCGGCGGQFSKKAALSSGHFFLYIPMKDQIKELLESGYVEREMVSCARDEDVLGDAVDGDMHKRFRDSTTRRLSRLTINWNFDGLPIHKSSCASLWPILAQLNELKPSARKDQMLMCGLWFGARKPLWSTYSKPFLEELETLGTVGIAWSRGDQAMRTTVGTLAIVCDSPARCMVQGTHQFNGAFGCAWCLHEGTVVPKGNGLARVYEHQANVRLRTQDNVINSAKTAVRENLDHHNGVKTASPLLVLPRSCGIDIVRSFSVDYMHAVLLGVVRQFLDIWFGPRGNSSQISIRGSLSRVDARLMSAKPPHDLSRTPRTLRDAGHWKASECRNWLLYYSVPALFGILPARYLDHWCLLVSAMYILLQDKVPVDAVEQAERKLSAFTRGVGSLYGREQMTSNVHACLHLAESVRSFGPLWACSGFPFEGYMMKIKQFFTGATNLPNQIANTFLMLRVVRKSLASPQCDGKVATLAKKWLDIYRHLDRAIESSDGAVGLNSAVEERLKPHERRLLVANGCFVSEGASASYCRRAIVADSICCTEEYGASQKRNSYTLFTRFGVGVVQSICFLQLVEGMKCFLFMKRMEKVTSPLALSLTHMQTVFSYAAQFSCAGRRTSSATPL